MSQPSSPVPRRKFITAFESIFNSTHFGWIQWGPILIIALAFIGMPQKPQGNDWDINTAGFWDDIPRTYLNNENFVYPPWGLILMLPYYWIRAEGVRVLSVLTIGWLVHRRKWPLSLFFTILLSPYFLLAMSISNMDVLVVVLPILLWEAAQGKKAQNIVRGLALAIMLLKPQCTLPVILILAWISRKDWKGLLAQTGVVALLVVPISLVGDPPLLLQWFDNIFQPSAANQAYWAHNNISLTQKWGPWIAASVLLLLAFGFGLLKRKKFIAWKDNQSVASFILTSMFLMPYTSVQSFVAGLVFVPSWPAFFAQWAVVGLGLFTHSFYEIIHLWSLSVAVFALLFFSTLMHNQPQPSV